MNKFQLPAACVLLIGLNALLNSGLNSGRSDKQLYFNAEEELDHRELQVFSEYNTFVEEVPISFSNVANVWDPVGQTDQPVFWYIAKCGGATFSTIIAKCLHVVQCSPKGDSTGKMIPNAPPVEVVIHNDDHGKYLNVNPVDAQGMYLLASQNVVANKQADIIITPLVTDAGDLMSTLNPGRFMVMLRHPVKREIDMFYYRQSATWDPNFDTQLATMSIHDYVDSNKLLDNFFTRSLLDLEQSAAITTEDITMAKAILRQKFIVGIFEWYEPSISRFEKYVGWWETFRVGSDPTVNRCHFDQVNAYDHDVGWNPDVPNGSPTWNKFIIRSWADVELYAYAKHLFSEQGILFQ